MNKPHPLTTVQMRFRARNLFNEAAAYAAAYEAALCHLDDEHPPIARIGNIHGHSHVDGHGMIRRSLHYLSLCTITRSSRLAGSYSHKHWAENALDGVIEYSDRGYVSDDAFCMAALMVGVPYVADPSRRPSRRPTDPNVAGHMRYRIKAPPKCSQCHRYFERPPQGRAPRSCWWCQNR